MSIHLINISYPAIFKRYSDAYNIFRDLYEIDLFALEIRGLEKTLAESLKSTFLSGNEICYIKPSILEGLVDFLALGTYSVIREIAQNNLSVIDEDLGHKVLRIINNYRDYRVGTFKIGDKELFLNKCHIMGILNVTPDSFSDGGKFIDQQKAVEHAFSMIKDGADIIDVGGESTRPGSDPVDLEEEIGRTIPVIEAIKKEKPDTIISIDTYKSKVAEKAIKAGAQIVNDISGGTFDDKIFDVVADNNSTIILMHIKGTPKNMQQNPEYSDVTKEIYEFLSSRVKAAKRRGVKNIILDPGIGFGKRVGDNYEILKRLDEFRGIGHPVLVGLSKKSFLGKSLELPLEDRENASVIAESFAINKGARFLRTHNVKNAVQAREILKIMQNPEILNNV